MWRPMRLALPLLAALPLAACGESTLDTPKVERFVRGVMVEQVGARVASVACPEEIEIKKGANFTCTVTGRDGSKGTVSVAQRGDDGKVDVNAPFLHVREAEAVMAREIADRMNASGLAVVCPEIVVVRKGARFRCRATSAGRTRRVNARLTDAGGHFTYRLS